MLLNRAVLFYWIRESFPSAKLICSSQGPEASVHNFVFWEGSKTEGGRCVLIPRDVMLHNVALPADCIFLFCGDSGDVRNRRGEFIILPENTPTDKICNCITRIFEKFDEWEKALNLSVTSYISFQSLIRSCDHLLRDPLALTDLQFHYISYSKKLAVENGFEDAYVDVHKYIPIETINIITSDPEYSALAEKPDVFRHIAVDDFLHKNVFFQEKCIGRLSIPYTKDTAKNDYYSWILSVLAGQIERLYEITGTFWSTVKQNQSVKELLSDLLSGTPIRMDRLQREMELLGYEAGQRYILTQLRSGFAENREKLNQILSTQIEDRYPGAISFTHEDRFYILMNLDQYQARANPDFYQTLAVFLRESLLKAGISRIFRAFSDLQMAAHQTDGAFEIGEQKDPMFWYYRFEDYTFDWLLLKGIGRFLPEHVASPVVLTLQDYDRENSTELEMTLRTYMRCHYNAVNTAKALYLARSSLLRRLERIEALTKIDWDNERTMAYISLSFQLFDAMSGISQTGKAASFHS